MRSAVFLSVRLLFQPFEQQHQVSVLMLHDLPAFQGADPFGQSHHSLSARVQPDCL